MNCGKEISSEAAFCPFCGKRTNFTSQIPSYTENVTPPFTGAPPTEIPFLEAREVVMKKKIFSMREHYDFEDPSGKKIGEGDGNFFQMPAKFVIYATSDSLGNAVKQEIMHIDGKLISLRHEFRLYDAAGVLLGTMKKKIVKLIGQEYWLERDGVELMRVYGNFTAHEYQMTINGQLVAQVHKKWVAIRDQFEVTTTGEVDHRLVLGAVIVVEHVEVTERDSNHNSGFSIGI